MGEHIERYIVLDWLGSGGMGNVYSAYDPQLDRRVALKVWRPDTPVAVDSFEERRLEDAKAMARVSHPNVIQVYEAGNVGDQHYLAMEFVEGCTLREWQSGREWQAILEMYLHAGKGLVAAHAAGIVHRNFKPENVLVGKDGRARVTDFGLARPELTASSVLDDQYHFAVALAEALKNADVPETIRAALRRGAHSEPHARFPSVQALLEALSVRKSGSRRAMAAMAIGLLLAAAIAVTWTSRRTAARMCGGADTRITGMWNDQRRFEIRSAFTATGAQIAQTTATLVERALNDYAQRWSAAYTDACEATHVRDEQPEEILDLRMGCLNDRLDEMKALTGLLVRADSKSIVHASEAVHDLSRVEDCSDVRALAAPMRPPMDVAKATEVSAIRSKLAEVFALRDAGNYQEGLTIVSGLATRVATTGYRPLEAETLFIQGELEGKTRDAKTAEETFYRALAAAEAGHHDSLVARIWIKLAYQVGVRGRRHEEALRFNALARAALERSGPNDMIEARRLSCEGLLLNGAGKIAESIETNGRAVALWRRVYGSRDDLDVALALQYLAESLHSAHRTGEAATQLQEALGMLERTVGPEHPTVAGVLDDIGSLRRDEHRYAEAMDFHHRAIAIAQKMAPGSSDVFYATCSLAEDFVAEGSFPRAVATYERAISLGEKALGAEAPAVGNAKRAMARAKERAP